MADHNDPNAVNTIFSDIDVSAADLYDLFGFPSDDSVGGEKVVVALTFAAVPRAGALDSDMLYRLQITPGRRVARNSRSGETLEAMLKYLDAVKEKYFGILTPSEVRVTVSDQGRATLRFSNFPGGSFAAEIDVNQSVVLRSPAGH